MLDQVNKPRIDVQAISGFPEHLPAAQAIEDRVVGTIRKHFSLFGAVSIKTPLVERIDVLEAKGGDAIRKEMYGLRRLGDSNDGSAANLGLKFDLTVPLARYVALRESNLVFPFRRQQVDRVHRGERPQSGRFREFVQADFDIIGRERLSVVTDAEPIALINQTFSELEVGAFIIRINNRKILTGYLQHMGLDEADQKAAIATIDKAEKGRDVAVRKLRENLGLSADAATQIVKFVTTPIDTADALKRLNDQKHNEVLSTGIDELVAVIDAAREFGVPVERIKIDLSVARGLDYYTGTVYETVLLDHLDLGSVCSGGRYDDLCAHFSKGNFPGVGISFGVSRLVTRLVEAGVFRADNVFKRHVFVVRDGEQINNRHLQIGAMLRQAGIPTEVYFEDHDPGRQVKNARRKGFGWAVTVGEQNKLGSLVRVHDLKNNVTHSIPEEQLAKFLFDQSN